MSQGGARALATQCAARRGQVPRQPLMPRTRTLAALPLHPGPADRSPPPAPSPLAQTASSTPPPLRHPVGRKDWITKINVFDDGKCITGVKPTYGYSASGARLIGKEAGRGRHIDLAPHRGEFVVTVDVKVGE